MILKCHTGLGGRVTAIANGLHLHGEIKFPWAVNEHCPLYHREVFRGGIPGVTFAPFPGVQSITRIEGRTCDQYRPGAADQYPRIIAAMAGARWGSFDAAICARFFRKPERTSRELAQAAAATGARTVLVMADTRRGEIIRELEALGLSAVLPRCRELRSDLSRTADDARHFLSDWKTMLACPVIITAGETALMHPFRARNDTPPQA